ncbi:MAG: flavodoxin family protein [Chloroflexota bacterium]
MATSPPHTPLHVLGIAGSPRRRGNTDMLLEEVMKGAASKGAATKTLVVCELDIAPCRHCDGCLETGRCVVEDDMQAVHRELRGTDRLVLASPIFFMGLTAQVKALIDRCQALWALKHVLKLPVSIPPGKERRGLFVSVGGMQYTTERLFAPARATVRAFFATLDIKYAGELVFAHVDEPGAIARHPTALRDAFVAGQDLASATETQKTQSRR